MQERLLLRHMANRNLANGGDPVTCEHEELINAVWDQPHHGPGDVTHLVSSLRRKVDRGHERPLIRTVVGMGYRLGDVEDEFGGLAREGR